MARTERRRETTRRVVEAAEGLFLERGYLATTMGDIAAAAGVAVQTLYLALGSKMAILGAVLDRAVAGDDEPVPVLQRQWVKTLEREDDGPRAVQLLVREGARVVGRSAPIYRRMQEAAADLEVAELLSRTRARRHETMSGLVAVLATKAGFARRLGTAPAADILYALVSEESYRLLCADRGWSPTEWQRWVANSLTQTYFPDGSE
ncbi:MAG TPA: helix-turn-helix domain-containing protein [Acidimicrobiales bacterium]|nr:helix-turn-helix domain-containing protein [Acidimicrobiales bacterium]